MKAIFWDSVPNTRLSILVMFLAAVLFMTAKNKDILGATMMMPMRLAVLMLMFLAAMLMAALARNLGIIDAHVLGRCTNLVADLDELRFFRIAQS